jgi:hypothetical protein
MISKKIPKTNFGEKLLSMNTPSVADRMSIKSCNFDINLRIG